MLQRQGEDSWLCLESEPTEKIDVDSPYDERFDVSVNLCVRAIDTVSVCFGGNSGAFWLGYMRSGSPDKQKEIEPFVLLEAQERLKSIKGKDGPWYAWGTKEITYHEHCVANSSPILAKTLVEMRNRLIDRLKVSGVGS